MKKFSRILIIVVLFVLLLVAIFTIGLRDSISTALTLKKAGENSVLYTVENKFPYDIEELINENISGAKKLISFIAHKISGGLIPEKLVDMIQKESGGFACTSVFCKTKDDDLFLARNFDYGTNGGILVMSKPEKGYKSLSMCSPEHIGLYIEDIENSFLARLLSGALCYIPVDGINEKGLAISINELPTHPANQNTGKPAVFTTCLIRMILDRCSTVEEAISFIETVDVHDNQLDMLIDNYPGSGYHYLIADATGDSVVIEFDYNNGFKTILNRRENSDYQVITNHYISKGFNNEGIDQLRSGERMELALSLLDNGVKDEDSLLEVMKKCELDPPVRIDKYDNYFCGTKWTSVYNLKEKTVSIRMGGETEIYSRNFQN